MTKTLSKFDLSQFTGSENWYRHPFVRQVLFTDGAKYVADQAGAYWLIDEIAFAQKGEPTVAAEEFQVWNLAVNANQTAVLSFTLPGAASPSGDDFEARPMMIVTCLAYWRILIVHGG